MRPDHDTCVLLAGPKIAADSVLRGHLEKDFTVLRAVTVEAARMQFHADEIDLVVVEQELPDGQGVEFLRKIRESHRETIRVLALAGLRRDDILRAVNEAAIHILLGMPIDGEKARQALRGALESRELARRHRFLSQELKFSNRVLHQQNENLARDLLHTYKFDKLLFRSDAMADACSRARRAAATELPVLIEGETGTGKELMARAMHLFSARNKRIFVIQNCKGLTDDELLRSLFGEKSDTDLLGSAGGSLAAADGGTIFLADIAEASLTVQAALLRFLQDGEYRAFGAERVRHSDVRIISGTSEPLAPLLKDGRFRRDLYYRLRGFAVVIPPLRERGEDIDVLTEYLLDKHATAKGRPAVGVTSEAMQKLRHFAFPGNVRELENEIQRAMAMTPEGELITVSSLSPEIANNTHVDNVPPAVEKIPKRSLKDLVEQVERETVQQALERHRWNQSRAARELGLSRVGIANKIQRYRLERLSDSDESDN